MLPRGGKPIANAVRRTVVDFVGDPVEEGRQRVLRGEIAARLQGLGGHVYPGDRGDPTRSFTGYATSPQRFVSAAAAASGIRPASGTYREASPTIDTARVGDNPYADPAARIFAQRMARRS